MTNGWLIRLQRMTGILADLCRVVAVGSIIAAVVWYGPAEIARFGLVFLGMLVPRLTRVPRPFDLAFCGTLLVAAWSGVTATYAAVTWWDTAVHAVTTGAVAAMVYLVLARLGVAHGLHETRPLSHHRGHVVVLTVALGLTVGVLWEFWEWIGHRYLNASIIVGYTDTLADLAAGGAGSLLAGGALVGWASSGWGTRRRDERHPMGRQREGRAIAGYDARRSQERTR
jgi:hypothetical protein